MKWDRYALSVVALTGSVFVIPGLTVAAAYVLGRRHRRNNAKKVTR